MTCYVDDIAISGKNANKTVLHTIRGILKRRGLKPHPTKESVFRNGVPKEITGSIVMDDGLKLPNRKHQQIHEEITSVLKMEDTKNKLDSINITMGRLIAASQSDPNLTQHVSSLRCEKNRIEKIIARK